MRTELVKLYTQRQKGMIPFNTLIGTGYSVVASERAKQEEKQLKDLSKFAKDVMVPLCLDNFQAEMRRYLSDTRGVMKVLHRHGLSSKYLGVIYSRVDAK